MTAAAPVERQLAAYNARDLDAFCACFREDIEVYDFPSALGFKGMEAFRRRYAERFSHPGLKAIILHRAVIGEVVVDHERVWYRGDQSDPIEVMAIYTIEDGLVARVDFIRQTP